MTEITQAQIFEFLVLGAGLGYFIGIMRGMIRAIKFVIDPRRERGLLGYGYWMADFMEQFAIKTWGQPEEYEKSHKGE